MYGNTSHTEGVPNKGLRLTAGGARGVDRVEGGRGYLMWDGGRVMSGRVNRVRVWPCVPAACDSRTCGSTRRVTGPPLNRGLGSALFC